MTDNPIFAGSRHRIRRWRNLGMSMGFGVGIEFLFRDDFITAEAAPLTSPRTAEPGPGTWNVTDASNVISIASENLVVNGVAAATSGLVDVAALIRSAGLAMHLFFPLITTNTGANSAVGWKANQALSATQELGIIPTPGEARLRINGIFFDGNFSDVLNQNAFQILRSAGGFVVFGDTLEWISVEGSTANLYPMIFVHSSNQVWDLSDVRISQLPSPWDTDYGIAIDRLAGARAPGDTFVHEADCLIEWIQTTVPGNDGQIYFRQQDAANRWQTEITSTGVLKLSEIVATVRTNRAASGAGAVANGNRVVIIADNETIRGYSNNTLLWTYALAANFKTATSGKLQTEGAGGSVSDIVSWPRVISGAALRALNRVADA